MNRKMSDFIGKSEAEKLSYIVFEPSPQTPTKPRLAPIWKYPSKFPEREIESFTSLTLC